MTDYEVFDTLLTKLRGMNGKSITLTKDDVYPNDTFLIFSAYDSITITFKKRKDGVWKLLCDVDDSILLEDCPPNFWRTLIINL